MFEINSTLLKKYPTILKHVGDEDNFLTIYKRVHTLESLPPPFLTEIPTGAAASGSTVTLPALYILNQLPKTHRLIEQIFLSPFDNYVAAMLWCASAG